MFCLVSPFTSDLIRCLLNTPSLFLINNVKIRAFLTLPLSLLYTNIALLSQGWALIYDQDTPLVSYSNVYHFKVTSTEEPGTIFDYVNLLTPRPLHGHCKTATHSINFKSKLKVCKLIFVCDELLLGAGGDGVE